MFVETEKYGIKEETEKKVKEISRRLNYEPNQIAKSLRLIPTYSIDLGFMKDIDL